MSHLVGFVKFIAGVLRFYFLSIYFQDSNVPVLGEG